MPLNLEHKNVSYTPRSSVPLAYELTRTKRWTLAKVTLLLSAKQKIAAVFGCWLHASFVFLRKQTIVIGSTDPRLVLYET